MALAVSLARRAGATLLGHLGRLQQVDRKGAIDLVTVADRESEAQVVLGIRSAFPGDGIVGEEGSSQASESGWTWVIDPLDGTTNFVHGFPQFMVAIGLTFGGRRAAGVCFAPLGLQGGGAGAGDLYTAELGRGAFRNGERLRVSTVATLADALACTGFPYDGRGRLEPMLARVGRALSTTQGIRRTGSACVDQCLVAAGALDVYFEEGLKPWDLTAASLIAEEAGATITDYAGRPSLLDTSGVLMTNGLLHADALARIIQG